MGDDRTLGAATSGLGKKRTAAKRKNEPRETYLAKRQEIVESAGRVFNKLGYERASVSAVANDAGIDRATLYYYFSSKDSLFDEVVRTVVERNLKMVQQIKDSNISPSRKLRELIMNLMRSYGDHYPFFYIYIRENLSHVSDSRTQWSKEMRDINRETTDAVIEIVEQGYRDGSLRKMGPASVVASGLFGIVGWTHRWFRPGVSEVSAEEIGKIYAEIFVSGIEAPYEVRSNLRLEKDDQI